MLKKITCITLLLQLALFSIGCRAGTGGAAPQNAGQAQSNAAGELKYKIPAGWVTEEPSSKMRVAQFKLARVAGDGEDASLVLYFFGSGQGGAVSDNVDRWVSQMAQPDGRPSKDKAKIETLTVNGLKVTTVDVSGTYTAQMSPGSDTRHNDSNQRLRAAVVETPKGNYFAKLIGPANTVSHWDQSFGEYVKSFEFK
jgi:hypothetical protein